MKENSTEGSVNVGRKGKNFPEKKNTPEMPRIQDDDQAAEYWETHSTAPYWDQMEPVDFEMEGERPTTTRINIRVNSKHLNQIKKIAKGKGIPYQTMIKMWLCGWQRKLKRKDKRGRWCLALLKFDKIPHSGKPLLGKPLLCITRRSTLP